MSIFLLVLFRQLYKWICQSEGTKHTAPFPLDDDRDCENDNGDGWPRSRLISEAPAKAARGLAEEHSFCFVR